MCLGCEKIRERIPLLEKRKVVYCPDGDGFLIVPGFLNKSRDWCRLLCVDTPEKHEANYAEAKKFLEEMVLNKWVSIAFNHLGRIIRDRYGRLLVYAFIDDLCVNSEIVKYGYSAWVKRWGRGWCAPMFQHALAWATDNRLGIWSEYKTVYRTFFGRGRSKTWFRSKEEFEKYIESIPKEDIEENGKVLTDLGFFAGIDHGKHLLSEQRRRLREGKRSTDQSQHCTTAGDQGIPE